MDFYDNANDTFVHPHNLIHNKQFIHLGQSN